MATEVEEYKKNPEEYLKTHGDSVEDEEEEEKADSDEGIRFYLEFEAEFKQKIYMKVVE